MRLFKLSLVFLVVLVCIPAQSQTANAADDQAVTVPRHSPNQLYHRFDYARRELSDIGNGDLDLALRTFAAIPSRSRIRPGISRGSALEANTCYKLRKYIFQPKEQVEKNGARPAGDAMEMVGETDCTYANKVWPKSVDGPKPPPPQPGVHSTVLRQK